MVNVSPIGNVCIIQVCIFFSNVNIYCIALKYLVLLPALPKVLWYWEIQEGQRWVRRVLPLVQQRR